MGTVGKHFHRLFCAAVLTCAVGAVFAPAAAEEGGRVLTIAADVWCPINCDPSGAEAGIGIDLAHAIFEPQGYAVRYVVMPWARALEEARSGRVDAVVGANGQDDPSLIFPRTPLTVISDDFYVRADTPPAPFHGLASLKGLRLGVIADYGYGPEVKAFIADKQNAGQVQAVAGETALRQNIKKLLAGRIDAAVESGIVMNYALQQMGLASALRRIGSLPQGPVYLAFSPKRPGAATWAATFDSGIQQLKAAGQLGGLYARYGMAPP